MTAGPARAPDVGAAARRAAAAPARRTAAADCDDERRRRGGRSAGARAAWERDFDQRPSFSPPSAM